ncbi:hypothetical protein FPQ18DRAFT_374139 [Pyronema domesticum]|nr:hypothetical protein FPQ18DRAFT_374139 [Pyronema domesticum]
MSNPRLSSIPGSLLPLLTPQTPPIILLLSGISGSGKSTLSHQILSRHAHFTRLSIDAHIFSHHGVYGVDYPVSDCARLQEEAYFAIREELVGILRGDYERERTARERTEGEMTGMIKRSVIVDLSMPTKEEREEWKELIGREGGKAVVVAFDSRGKEEVLWDRVRKRREGKEVGADNACEVTREMLKGFMEGFEWPEEGEAEVVIRVGEEEGEKGEEERGG